MSLHVEAVRSEITILATVYVTKNEFIKQGKSFQIVVSVDSINIVVFVQMATVLGQMTTDHVASKVM